LPKSSLFSGKEALRELAGDIAERGLIDPIVPYDGRILDGRCRYRACLMVGVEPRFENYPLGYVASRNVQRRHLMKEGSEP
jgi:ParB-like chromosome segregation protein Spo0J